MRISMARKGASALVLGCFANVAVPAQTDWSVAALPHTGHAMAFDAARGRTVLFGDMGGTRGGQPLALTWEWDGTTWTKRPSATTPPSRTQHAMAYDSARGRIVLFGGSDGSSVLADTWEWDGTDWRQRTSAATPPARRAHAMAYDATRGRVVLFGGSDDAYLFSILGDTWEWDGTNWTQRSPATNPAPRLDHSMIHDPLRSRTVMFGGLIGAGIRDPGVWEWDGIDWVQATANPPRPFSSARGLAWDSVTGETLTFDPFWGQTWTWDGVIWTLRATGDSLPLGPMTSDTARGRVVLGSRGDSDEVWEWDGAAWSLSNTGPLWRTAFAMSYHSASRNVVLFSGSRYWNQFNDQDTWLWNGSRWNLAAPAMSPPARQGGVLTDRTVRGAAVLFGGEGRQGMLADTWEWNGSSWNQRNPAASPTARRDHAMAYDTARDRIVLFGGSPDGTVAAALGDTWEWDGTTWSQLIPPSSPPPRVRHHMAHDVARNRTVLYGGWARRDTWEWDGQSWTQATPTTIPDASWGGGMWYDQARGRVVLFGGYGFRSREETWQWDGTDWALVSTRTSPDRRSGHRAVYDPSRGVAVLFGGENFINGGTRFRGTWLYGTSAGYVVYGAGCAGTVGVPALAATAGSRPEVGGRVSLQLVNLPFGLALMVTGFSDTMAGNLTLPLALAPFGMPGCSLLAEPFLTTPTLGPGTSTTWSLAIPDDLALLGLTFYNQAFVYDPMANAAGVTVTNGGRARIGF